MVKYLDRTFRPESPSVEVEYPQELRILRRFLEQGPPATLQDRIAARRAFRDAGFLDILNFKRETLGESLIENMGEVSWHEMGEVVEEKMAQEAAARANHEAWLARIEEQDAEEAADAEARQYEGEVYKKFAPMTQGPEEAEKRNKQVPYEYRSVNRKQYRMGAPTEMSPEEYRTLQLKRSKMIEERFPGAIISRKRELASLWLQKKYIELEIPKGDTLELFVLRVLDGEKTRAIRPEDIELAYKAAEQKITKEEIENIRRGISLGVESELGWHAIAREVIEKPVNWKDKKKTRH